MKLRKGQSFTCQKCSSEFYCSPARAAKNPRFCSLECYSEAGIFNGKNRATERPWRKNGQTFDCPQCGEKFYRKASFIARGITKTCGKRECISKSMQKDGNPYWGKDHSPEVREALKAARAARPEGKRSGPPKGYKHTPEAKEAMSAALRKRWAENRDKMLAQFAKAPKPREEQRYRQNFTPWQRENWKGSACVWCASTEELILDHVLPVSAGGVNIKENAQTLCQPCNLWKAHRVDRPLTLATLAIRAAT